MKWSTLQITDLEIHDSFFKKMHFDSLNFDVKSPKELLYIKMFPSERKVIEIGESKCKI